MSDENDDQSEVEDERLHQTLKLSLTEIEELQRQIDDGGPEIVVRVTPEVLARVDALVPKMGDGGDINFNMALRQIFMAGLYSLEREFEE